MLSAALSMSALPLTATAERICWHVSNVPTAEVTVQRRGGAFTYMLDGMGAAGGGSPHRRDAPIAGVRLRLNHQPLKVGWRGCTQSLKSAKSFQAGSGGSQPDRGA